MFNTVNPHIQNAMLKKNKVKKKNLDAVGAAQKKIYDNESYIKTLRSLEKEMKELKYEE